MTVQALPERELQMSLDSNMDSGLTAYERSMDYLSDEILFDLKDSEYRMSKLILKCTGLSWLAILTATHDGESFVAFFAGDTLKKISGMIKRGIAADDIKWKIDQYANNS